MDPENIGSLASECYSRGALAGFQAGSIRVDGDRFTLSPVEAAVTERAVRSIESEESILIETSFPSNSIPVGLAVALAFDEHPNRGGANSPVLLFPRQGYTTVFDRFHYRDTTNPTYKEGSDPIPRYPVNSLSEMAKHWGIFTANSQFNFDIESGATLPAGIIIDLRAPRWHDTYARQLVELFAAAGKGRVAFIGDADGYGMGYDLARTHSDEQIQIRPTHLESSPIKSIPVDLDTKLAIIENLLAVGDVSYDYYSIVAEEVDQLHQQFAAKKIELQERDIAPKVVGGLYNRLTQLPVKPKYWNRVSKSNGYFDSIPQQIDRLNLIAEQISRGGGRIRNFTETATQLEATLNDEQPLQNYLLNAAERARELDNPTRFVFSNKRVQEAFILAAEERDLTVGESENIVLTTKSDIDPVKDSRTVYAGVAPRDSNHYEFPRSETVAFVHHAILNQYIIQRARGLAGGSISHEEHTVGDGSLEGEPIDLDDIESEVTSVGPVESNSMNGGNASQLMSSSSLWGGDNGSEDSTDVSPVNDSGNTDSDDESEPSERLKLTFDEDHEPITLTPLSRVTKYSPAEGDIVRTRANSLESGDTILLIDDLADDIYDIVIDHAQERESIREDTDLVEGWRDQLNRALEQENWTVKEFQQQLQDMGSDITSPVTISLWRYGRTIAPDDPEDIKRVYQLCRPGVDGSMFETLAAEVNKAAQRIRDRHNKIGQRIRPLIEHELDATTDSSQSQYYDEATRRRIREDTKRLTTRGIDQLETSSKPSGNQQASESTSG